MIKSLEDLFKSKEAIFNDPLKEIHTPVQSVNTAPNIDEYEELLSDIDMSVYPTPTKERYHRIVDPMHGKLKSVYNK